ncbi:protein hinderin isoform X2 [Acanthochromis polyacanthus]|uniref:protein hinderin isoform X2 n=1 Tax=Acanthochromis polyacanthus TaxID=80966 RepID=UPI002234882C|nr:protein hinderin isoform X2 [Acanthochromis polyacanthus]
MAAEARRSGSSGIFWMNDDEEQPLVFVPGVDEVMKTRTPFNLGYGSACTSYKRGSKMQIKGAFDSKNQATQKRGGKKQAPLQSDLPGVSARHTAAVTTEQMLFSPSSTFPPTSQVISETSRPMSEVCLKDLCPEDKRRIANLIEELARVSEEREESVQRLKDEQGNFGRKIQQLEQQNLIIAQERESLQQQYRECQELLGLYQQYLSQQQTKINQSITQLSQPPTHSRVLSGEEAPSRTSTSRANGSLFDGSYLSLAATGPQMYRRGDGVRTVQTLRNPASLSGVDELSLPDGPIKQQICQNRACRELHSCQKCEHCQCSGHDTGYGAQQWRSNNRSCLANGYHDTFTQEECERLQSEKSLCSEAKEALTRPLLGHEDWEEKRHQLLLQKLQLAMERERLQARLAEQEERLNRQNQQLHQSRLDYSRFQQSTQAEGSSSKIMNGGPEPEGPSHQDLPSSVCEDAEEHPAGQSLHEKNSRVVPAHVDNDNGPLKQSRRDMATSPAKSPASLNKPTSASVIHQIPEARFRVRPTCRLSS